MAMGWQIKDAVQCRLCDLYFHNLTIPCCDTCYDSWKNYEYYNVPSYIARKTEEEE